MASSVQRVQLRNLYTDTGSCMLVAVIIAKSGARIFRKPSVIPGASGESRGVFSFTIRDSPLDTANCSVWGSPQFVMSYDQMFHVGDVVDIINPQIKSRQLEDRNEQYQPQVSSPFRLVLNERQSEMTIHEADNYVEYISLLHIPTKFASGYFTLTDIRNKSQDLTGDTVDLLVAIRSIMAPRSIKTKLGEEVQMREISVMDQSTTEAFKIMLWEPESIKRASSWQPRETILFISDIKLEWNNFNKAIVGRVNSRTVITEDPHTAEAESLRVYARHAPIQKNAVLDQLSQDIPDPNSIRSVMTVQQVLDKSNYEDHTQFTALMYAVITHMDLDGCAKTILTKCGSCMTVLKDEKLTCENMDCSTVSGNEMVRPEISFNILVTLTDHTGSLRNCKLFGKFAETVLGCQVQDFMKMDIDAKGQLKWRLLLERCSVRVLVMKGPLISILTCSVADPNEVVSKLPVY